MVTIIIITRKLMIKQRKLNCLFVCYEEETRTLLMIQPETLINDFFPFLKMKIDDLPLCCVYKADSSWHSVYISIIICSNQRRRELKRNRLQFWCDRIYELSYIDFVCSNLHHLLSVSHARGKSKDDLSITISCFGLSCFPKANY